MLSPGLTASHQQNYTPPLKIGPTWTYASTRWDACAFSTRSQRSASDVITVVQTSFYSFFKRSQRSASDVLPSFDRFFKRSQQSASDVILSSERRSTAVRPFFLNGLTALPRFSAMVWKFKFFFTVHVIIIM